MSSHSEAVSQAQAPEHCNHRWRGVRKPVISLLLLVVLALIVVWGPPWVYAWRIHRGPSRFSREFPVLLSYGWRARPAVGWLLSQSRGAFATDFRSRLYEKATLNDDWLRPLLIKDLPRIVHCDPEVAMSELTSFPFQDEIEFQRQLLIWARGLGSDPVDSIGQVLEGYTGPLRCKELTEYLSAERLSLLDDLRRTSNVEDITHVSGLVARVDQLLGRAQVDEDLCSLLVRMLQVPENRQAVLDAISEFTSYQLLHAIHQATDDPEVHAAALHGLCHIDAHRTRREYQDVLAGTDSPDRKSLVVYLCRHGVLPPEAMDEVFKGTSPRVIQLHQSEYRDLSSTEEYQKIVGHDYIGAGKQVPPMNLRAINEVMDLPGFLNRYPWHPAADDAAARLAFSNYQLGRLDAALSSAALSLSSPDGDAHELAKAVVSLVMLRSVLPEHLQSWRRQIQSRPLDLSRRELLALNAPELVFKVNALYLQMVHEAAVGDAAKAKGLADVLDHIRLDLPHWKFSPLIWGNNMDSTRELIDLLASAPSSVERAELLLLGMSRNEMEQEHATPQPTSKPANPSTVESHSSGIDPLPVLDFSAFLLQPQEVFSPSAARSESVRIQSDASSAVDDSLPAASLAGISSIPENTRHTSTVAALGQDSEPEDAHDSDAEPSSKDLTDVQEEVWWGQEPDEGELASCKEDLLLGIPPGVDALLFNPDLHVRDDLLLAYREYSFAGQITSALMLDAAKSPQAAKLFGKLVLQLMSGLDLSSLKMERWREHAVACQWVSALRTLRKSYDGPVSRELSRCLDRIGRLPDSGTTTDAAD